MTHYKYLIIGGVMTADAAVQGIRKVDHTGRIGVISSEVYPPYKRPPLSKGLWKGESLDSIWLTNAKTEATLHLSCTATAIKADAKQVVDDKGDTYTYDKLLLATGGSVRKLPFNVNGINYYRTVEDYKALKQSIAKGKRCAVIGGGFIGSEIAASLAMNGQSVTMIFPEDAIGARVYPKALSSFLNDFYGSKGVEVRSKDSVSGIELKNSKYYVSTGSGKVVEADTVVAGIGIQPNVALAQSAGLEIDNGIHVNELLQTSNPDIFAAGDVAQFYNPTLDMRLRVEHEDNANAMGERAGKNMAGENEMYNYLPFFYSDLFDLGYEAVGLLDSRFEIVEDWKDPFREGVLYYLDNKRLCGVLLWNTWGQVDNARALIASGTEANAEHLKGKLPV